MCLFGKSPAWEDDVVFANRRHGRKHRTRVTETIVERTPKYVPAPPRSPSPIIHPATPPRAPSPAPTSKKSTPPPPPQPTIELVSVEEDRSSSGPKSSRVSVSRKSRHGSRGGEEVYIERERVRERLPPVERASQEYDTYRYVEAPMPPRKEVVGEERIERKRSRSITYQTNPRMSGRVVERERVVVEDGGRRREYYRKP
ncbi:uncharacterized protein LY89DRAFT_305701 [Mollisia scopiformis]|uniref:Uncharacterized protein n=1 Tax=Mollisia scopiformis TaxID=149040 RepID=A0A194XR32_MOLSC|nr:uncharacterized protein LY89DRAFT_305701 [Mollisia scopiformis]KUJ22611.1 hypothetical protein LY89DRAFT_305701 [Mollisia scopiformis]